MPKLSPHHLDGKTKQVPTAVKEYLDNTYLRNLPNIDQPNPKLLVVFNGGNGVGKSTLARKIQDELGGLVIENDEIKELIFDHYPNLEKTELNSLTWNYTIDLYKRLNQVTPNGLVVRDGVIGWYFEQILPIFEQQRYRLFIIDFDISAETTRANIIKRGPKKHTTVERLLELMEDHDIHNRRFRTAYRPDIVLYDKDIFNHHKVVAALRLKLDQLRSPQTTSNQ